jgi:hypothetical protein
MRSVLSGLLVLGLLTLVVPGVGADAQADALAIIAKGIQAAGGEANLAKFNAMTWNEKGTYYGQGNGLPYTGKYAIEWPDRFRMDITGVFTLVVNGDKGWMKSDKGTIDMTKEQVAGQKEDLHGGWVSHLLPIVKNKGFTLTPLGESKIDGKAVLAVKVAHKGYKDVELYFDKASGLLIRSVYEVRSEEQGGKSVKQEVTFSDYKELAGGKHAAKLAIKRDGKLFLEAENLDVKPGVKFDDKTFAKP